MAYNDLLLHNKLFRKVATLSTYIDFRHIIIDVLIKDHVFF